jgi:hypothetical protein
MDMLPSHGPLEMAHGSSFRLQLEQATMHLRDMLPDHAPSHEFLWAVLAIPRLF